MKILITCVGGELMPEFITFLKNNKEIKVDIIGVDKSIDAVGRYFCDNFYKVPAGNGSNYMQVIKKIILKEKIKFIIPTSDEEALKFAKNREVLSKMKAQIACTDFDTLQILNNKAKTYSFLEKKGYKLGKWIMASQGDDLINKAKTFYKKYGALVIKPTSGRGSKGIFIINRKLKKFENEVNNIVFFNGIEDFINRHKKYTFHKRSIIMEKLYGPVCDIDMLSWKGEAISIICRSRIHESWPNRGHRLIINKKVLDLGKKIIKDFNLSWLYDCDVMFNKKGFPIPIEINPRQSGSIAVSIKAGSNIINNLLRIYLGKKPIKEEKQLGSHIIPYTSLLKKN